MSYSYIYEARMSSALNGSSAIWRFEGSDAIEIRDGITFDFYTGLPHVNLYCMYICCVSYFLKRKPCYSLASLGHQGGGVSALIGLITSADFNRVLTNLKLMIIDFKISAGSQP